jgi:hypothetical protein
MLGPVCDGTQLNFVVEQVGDQISSKELRIDDSPVVIAWPFLKEDLI